MELFGVIFELVVAFTLLYNKIGESILPTIIAVMILGLLNCVSTFKFY